MNPLPAIERAALELDRLRKEVDKLSLEIEALRSVKTWDRVISRYLPLLTALVAAGAFLFTIIQYHGQQIDASRSRTEELKREAARPFWETQLRLYVRAAEAVATIATSDQPESRNRAESDFWLLYWGPLATVEDVAVEKSLKSPVESAMVAFGNYLQDHRKARDPRELKKLSLDLAHAMRAAAGPAFQLEPAVLTNGRDAQRDND